MKYKKKPIIIEAFIFGFEAFPEWMTEDKYYCYEDYMRVCTLEGNMTALKGDYIIKGIKGEIYPCRGDIFEATYEAIE